MGRRSDHTREQLREIALDAAAEIVAAEGLRGLTTRRISDKIGYTVGTLYNVFEDLDDLIIQLDGRTLDALHEYLSEVPLDGEPEVVLKALAERYVRFSGEHARLWSLLFEHALPEGQPLPDWYEERTLRLLGFVEAALKPLFKPGEEEKRRHTARVLWSSLHGMCSLEGAPKLGSNETLSELVDTLVTNFVAGLRAPLSLDKGVPEEGILG